MSESPEVPLEGRLQEFRTALREEIEASKRAASSSAVPLVHGRRIGQIGARFQYTFEIENVLNLPGDAPGDLQIEGRAPLEVDVVSVDGLTVILSLPEDVGAVVPFARLQSNLTFLMRKLIARIEAMASTPNPVGDRILDLSAVEGTPCSINLPQLNAGQTKAVASSIGRNITFIWGPPGTGKTHTIGTIAEQLFSRNRSVLLVSHTNTAVDQAVLHINRTLSSTPATDSELDAGRVLRVGEPSDPSLAEQSRLLLQTHVERRSAELTARRESCQTQLETSTAEAVRLAHLTALWEWTNEAKGDIDAMQLELDQIHTLEQKARDLATEHKRLDSFSKAWSTAVAAAKDAAECLKRMERLQGDIAKLASDLQVRQSTIRSHAARVSEAERTLHETNHVNWMIRAWKGLPKPDEQQWLVAHLRNELSQLQAVATNVERQLRDISAQHATLASQIDAFNRHHGSAPHDIFRKGEEHASRLREISAAMQQAVDAGRSLRLRFESTLVARLRLIEKIGYQFVAADTAEDMLKAVRGAYVQSYKTVQNYDIRRLRSELESANGMAQRLTSEIAEIDEQLKTVEQTVIAEARIVATTLTRAYLRDTIQSRRFDTIILDEASMAPIPALWIAASITDTNAVLVGDFKQLPPIVQAKHSLAEKWLGRDVFEVADLTRSDGCPPFPDILCPLFEQRRMHRAISAIPNRFIYHGQLQDGAPASDDGSMSACYCRDNGLDAPVLLVDTESLHAWVSNAGRSGTTSRLNFLSATVCVDLVTQCLRPDRPPHRRGDRPRIRVVSPYRPHARLISLLLRCEGLSDEVHAGTVHSFQGNQADIVIFDLVNDEPHWRVRLFTPSTDNDTRRLVNVAVTRARQRLIVVGDFAYHLQQAGNAFLGKELVPYLLERYRRVDAKAIVPAGFAARATAAQSMVQGGVVECSSARSVVTQKDFYRFLSYDVQNAKQQLVIYSPFLSQNRLGELQSVLLAAIERSVKIFVITKPLQDRNRHETEHYQRLEKALAAWHIKVVHKARMHEKLVFVDDDVVWTGSLNPLSFRDTQEVMERRRSLEVVADYKQTLRLDELLREYDTGRPTCPWCGSEVIAAEGQDDPFYWRCVKYRCYSRSVGEPPLLGDIVLCKKCQSDVEYTVRGAKSIWRCKGNARHYQFVKRMHLRLPKMRAIVPPAILRELDEQFGVTSDDIIDAAGCRERPGQVIEDGFQGTLFDGDLLNDTETCNRNHTDGLAKRESGTTMNSAGDGLNSGKSATSGMRSPRLSESLSSGQEPPSASSTRIECTKQSSACESERGDSSSLSAPSQWRTGMSGQKVFVTPGERASVVRALEQAGRSLIMWQLAQHAELPEWRMEKILPVLVDDGCVKLDRDADANRYRLPER